MVEYEIRVNCNDSYGRWDKEATETNGNGVR
jgi:hypothetical protein